MSIKKQINQIIAFNIGVYSGTKDSHTIQLPVIQTENRQPVKLWILYVGIEVLRIESELFYILNFTRPIVSLPHFLKTFH